MSEAPSAVWVAPGKLRPSRWAPEFYRREFIQLEEQLEACGQPLIDLRDLAHLCSGPFGSELPSSIYNTPDGIPLLRVQNIGEFFLIEDDLARIPREVHRSIDRSKLEPGDLALAKAGRLGALSRIPQHIRECNITQHIVGVKVRPGKVHPGYLAAFFLSRFGRFQLKRQGIGTLIKYLGIEETRGARVPLPDGLLQKHVGSKVDLAECCRREGMRARSDAVAALLESWEYAPLQAGMISAGAAKSHLVSPNGFDDRIDAEFYQPRFMAIESWLRERDCWVLGELVHSPVKGVQPFYDNQGSIPALTVTHVDPFLLDRAGASESVTVEWLAANPRATIEAGEILFTVTGPPLGEAVVVEKCHLPAAVNSHVARIRPRGTFAYPNLLAGMFNTQLGQLLTTRYCKGIRQKELYPADLLRFRFPILPPKVIKQLEHQFRRSCLLVERARQLVEEAKADVEALIEGDLDTKGILAGRVKPPTAEEVLGAIEAEVAR